MLITELKKTKLVTKNCFQGLSLCFFVLGSKTVTISGTASAWFREFVFIYNVTSMQKWFETQVFLVNLEFLFFKDSKLIGVTQFYWKLLR